MNHLPIQYTCDKSIEAYKKTNKYIEDSDFNQKLFNLFWSFHNIWENFPQTEDSFWSGHFFPLTESFDEIQISFDLCSFGLYKQAMISLRNSLELGLLSVYWNLNDDGHIIVKDWLNSNKDTPRIEEISKKLFNNTNFKKFQESINLEKRLIGLKDLHNYVHTKGYKYSNDFGLLRSVQSFEEEAFKIWYQSFEEVVKVIVLLHLIKYPIAVIRLDYGSKFGINIPRFGCLQDFQIDLVEELLSKEEILIIKKLARNNPEAKQIIEYVSSLPHLSEKQKEEQIFEFDKRLIKSMGFNGWLKNENQTLLQESNSINKEKILNKISNLTKWVEETNLTK